MSFWTQLCALVVESCWSRKGHPQTVPTKLGAWKMTSNAGVSRVQLSDHSIQRPAGDVRQLDAAAQLWKPSPWSSLHAVVEIIWRPHEVWRSWFYSPVVVGVTGTPDCSDLDERVNTFAHIDYTIDSFTGLDLNLWRLYEGCRPLCSTSSAVFIHQSSSQRAWINDELGNWFYN